MSCLLIVLTVVKSVKTDDAGSTAGVSLDSDKLFKHKSTQSLTLNTNASICAKEIYFISFKVPSALRRCNYHRNLQITLQLKTVICFLRRQLTSHWWIHGKSIQAWHSELALPLFLHGSSGFAATTRQKDMPKNVQSVVGSSAGNIQQIHWKIAANVRTT